MSDSGFDFDAPTVDRLRARRGMKWNRFDLDVIPAWVADMDFPPPPPVARVLAEALAIGDVGYPPKTDPGPLPDLFASWAEARYDWRPDPARIETLVDVVQGLYVAAETFAGPGDGMLAFTPIYPPFLKAVADTGRRLVEHPLVPGPDGYEIDLDRLRAGAGDGTRVLMWCNPHNPTGRVFTRAEQEAVAEVVLARDLVVVADEIHADLVFSGHEHVPFANLDPAVAERTVTFASVTKAFNTAGLRGAIAHFGSEDLRARFNRIPPRIRGGTNAMGLYATMAAWQEGAPWLAALLRYLEGNRDFLGAFLARELPDVVHRPPEATYLAWLDCRPLDLAPDPFTFFLGRARVGLSDGRDFGAPGAGHVRLNFATSRSVLTEILERMAAAIEGRRP